MHRIECSPRFSLGRKVITSSARHELTWVDIAAGLRRHVSGDWGEVDEFDWTVNDDALEFGDRLLSVYRAACGTVFWIITERDRSLTTILLPEEH